MAHNVGVIGATGYTGAELLRLLAGHPGFTPVVATSREAVGTQVSSLYPNQRLDLTFSEFSPAAARDLDLVFLALPHGASMDVGAALAAEGARVIDLSADFRFRDSKVYPAWFGKPHSAPGSLAGWTYGLPELHRDAIAASRTVANPGCYPTAAVLALAPLVARGVIDASSIIISAASGVSGAGRAATPGVHFSHVDANFKAYGLPRHKHTPEIEQELSALAGSPVTVTFVPHLVPMPRGLLATCIARWTGDEHPQDIARAFYEHEPFISVIDATPETKYTHGSNHALVHYELDERTGRVIALCAIDNLGKGAAGQAIQNANLMFGFAETTGLEGAGVYP